MLYPDGLSGRLGSCFPGKSCGPFTISLHRDQVLDLQSADLLGRQPLALGSEHSMQQDLTLSMAPLAVALLGSLTVCWRLRSPRDCTILTWLSWCQQNCV